MMSYRLACVQSNYVPWKGYFDMIAAVDEFVLLDDVQYTRRDWRNRNRIKSPKGPMWLTIPVTVKHRFHQRIREVEIADAAWPERHWQSIVHGYRRTRSFAATAPWLEQLYAERRERLLSDVNRAFLEAICARLGIPTRLTWSWHYDLPEGRTERLIAICRQAGANVYLSGPAAKGYLDVAAFEQAGIRVEWMEYGGYPTYEQPFPPFEHRVSIVDLLLCEGDKAPAHLVWSRNRKQTSVQESSR